MRYNLNCFALLLPSFLEPTLTELVGLKTPDDPWPVTTPKSSTTSTRPTRRTSAVEQPDAKSNDPSQWGSLSLLSSFESPKFYNDENTSLWRYWLAEVKSMRSDKSEMLASQLAFPSMEDVLAVDPWEVSIDYDPPFYRKFFTEPSCGMSRISHTTTTTTDADFSYPDRHWSDGDCPTALPGYHGEHWKTSPASHVTSPLHSHL